MSSPIQFSATVLCEAVDEEPFETTLRLGQQTLGLDDDDHDTEITLADVFDVRIGPPPPAIAGTFSGTVLTMALRTDETQQVLFVDRDEETLERFRGLLYRRLLDETEAAVRHPAEIGGRTTGESFDIGTLLVAPGKVGGTEIGTPFSVDLDAVVDFSEGSERLLGDERPVVRIQYVKRGVAVSLDLSITPERKHHLLGRYLRRDYDEIKQQVTQLDLPAPALRALFRLYALRGTAKPQSVLSDDNTSTAAVLRGLADADLVETSEGRIKLTSRGWILVTERADDTAVDTGDVGSLS
jgi:hypothetical protein